MCDPALGMTSDGGGGCVPNCSAIPGCSACQADDPTQCQACDAAAGFRGEPASGGCVCDAAAGFYDDGAGGCAQQDCDPISGCVQQTCDAGVGRCSACDAAVGFKTAPVDGECECDAAAGYVADGAGGCTKQQQPDCTATIPGCKTCLATDRTRCAACNTAANFKQTPVSGKCECATGYQLQNGNVRQGPWRHRWWASHLGPASACRAPCCRGHALQRAHAPRPLALTPDPLLPRCPQCVKVPAPSKDCDADCADCDGTTGACRKCSAGYGPDGANKAVVSQQC